MRGIFICDLQQVIFDNPGVPFGQIGQERLSQATQREDYRQQGARAFQVSRRS